MKCRFVIFPSPLYVSMPCHVRCRAKCKMPASVQGRVATWSAISARKTRCCAKACLCPDEIRGCLQSSVSQSKASYGTTKAIIAVPSASWTSVVMITRPNADAPPQAAADVGGWNLGQARQKYPEPNDLAAVHANRVGYNDHRENRNANEHNGGRISQPPARPPANNSIG